MKNTGEKLEKDVYKTIEKLVCSRNFMLSDPYVKVYLKKKYYSIKRGNNIEFDVVVEKYLIDPEENPDSYPALKVVIECKDYKKSIPVDGVEEFFAKIQQVGAANTKGMMITRNANFQKSALTYAKSKGIALARLLPIDQVTYLIHSASLLDTSINDEEDDIINALTEREYVSGDHNFFVTSGENSMEALICNSLGHLMK